jgi:hypothetical protein
VEPLDLEEEPPEREPLEEDFRPDDEPDGGLSEDDIAGVLFR